MGRINYGPKMFDKKGIVGGVLLGQRYHFGWNHYSLPMEDLSGLSWKSADTSKMPTFYKGTLDINDETCDTFVRPDSFEKGFVMVNGFNIGIYYNSAGPQETLYIPAPILKQGKNEIIVFESDYCKKPEIEFFDTADLG